MTRKNFYWRSELPSRCYAQCGQFAETKIRRTKTFFFKNIGASLENLKTRMKNPLTNKHIFYHVTDRTRVESIFKKGLRINSKPVWYKKSYPFICISTMPFYDYMIDEYKILPNPILIEINLKGFGSAKEINKWNNSEFCNMDWQIKIYRNISSDRLRVKKITKAVLKKTNYLIRQWDKKYK